MISTAAPELARIAGLIVQEMDEAAQLASYGALDEAESRLIAKTFAAGIAQLGMLLTPLRIEAITAEQVAAGFVEA